MGIRYTTRESVKEALDIKESAHKNAQVDRAIESASRAVEGLLHRRFHPWSGTRYFDWPAQGSPTSYRLWLDGNELVSVASLISGGVTIPPSDYFLRRADGKDEAPYTCIELDLADSASFTTGGTHQRNIAVTGVYGYGDDTEPAGALAEALDASETAVDVTDSSLIGVGDLIKVGSEYMNVTGKAMLDTGVDIHATDSLAAQNSDVSLTVSTTTGMPQVGETILIDSERMLVVDLAGSVLTVKRAQEGSVLAAHAAGASIHAPRTLTVERAAVGSTAAAHDTATAVRRHVVPGPVQELTLAYAINHLLNRSAGYARTAGEGESAREFTGRGIRSLEKDVVRSHGRQLRLGGV